MDNQVITLKSTVDAYLKHLSDSGTKETTVGVYKRSLDLAISHFGEDKLITSILVPHVSRFFEGSEVNTHKNGKPNMKNPTTS